MIADAPGIPRTGLVTADEFDVYVNLPENRVRLFEYIGGEIIEGVPNPYSSETAMTIGAFIKIYLLQNDIGHLTGADGGYMVSGERYIPDVGFISYQKQAELSYIEGYMPNPPDLAIEVLSPGNNDEDMAVKIANYLAAGTIVWMFKPLKQQVIVFKSGEPSRTLAIDGILDGGAILPGFKLAVKDVFKKKK